MSEEDLINSTPVQTAFALVESGVLQEIYVERRQPQRGWSATSISGA